ncbi:hypothetical protein LTR66_015300, partial [Elasticomyces elasticus]
MENILKMFRVYNAPTVPIGDDELAADVDEPPDQVIELDKSFKKEVIRKRPDLAGIAPRRESLLTRAILSETESQPTSPQMNTFRGLSTTSSISFASTAELTSDVESSLRSATPSPPPLPTTRPLLPIEHKPRISFASTVKEIRVVEEESGEAAIEKTLGRKRCIMFACKGTEPEKLKEEIRAPKEEQKSVEEPAPRRTRISFACVAKPDHAESSQPQQQSRRQSSPVPKIRQPVEKAAEHPRRATEAAPPKTLLAVVEEKPIPATVPAVAPAPIIKPASKQFFHEFASSQDEVEDWVNKDAQVVRPKLTIDDCMKKENAIRRIGKEAEEEAEEEEREQDEVDEEDDDDQEDDFAPSEKDQSDGGNESDDEGGFADSDDESDTSSNYPFWTPGTANTART